MAFPCKHVGFDQRLHCLSSGISSSSQNEVLHNFLRHQREADRAVIVRVFFLALLENWNNIF